ncbi:hypothetical protein Tco_0677814 [Tanacetum coccineum]|uniref:Uncharacterized protein n=1 Tax=Tanacetum coccineum TaxID=301880 RepID=A0ABQ4XEF1_9ASTR
MSNDEIEKFGGNSRVCESESELQANNTGERRIVDDNNDGADGDKLDKLDKTNESNQCNANEVLNEMPNGNGDKDNTYADKVISVESDDDKLEHIPTVLNENGQEFVIFYKEIVKEGSKKWELSVCGYFVGYRMTIQELRQGVSPKLNRSLQPAKGDSQLV